MHTNTFCKYRKNYSHRLACILLVVFFFKKKNYLMSSLAMSVRPSVRLSVCPSVRLSVCPSVRHLWKYLWNAVAV